MLGADLGVDALERACASVLYDGGAERQVRAASGHATMKPVRAIGVCRRVSGRSRASALPLKCCRETSATDIWSRLRIGLHWTERQCSGGYLLVRLRRDIGKPHGAMMAAEALCPAQHRGSITGIFLDGLEVAGPSAELATGPRGVAGERARAGLTRLNTPEQFNRAIEPTPIFFANARATVPRPSSRSEANT